MTILDEIIESKWLEIEAARERISDSEMATRAQSCEDEPRGFRAALAESPAPAIIAEIKRRSPSRGEIRHDFDPVVCAHDYEEGGAAALSVLTDEPFFGGHLDTLRAVRAEVGLPLLRKDFVLSPYQVDEARAAGADALLLIVAALEPDALDTLHGYARQRQLDVLVEVHDEAEMEVALGVGADLVGVNNRDLRTFDVDLGVTERLGKIVAGLPDVLLVAESGIHLPEDTDRLGRAGARAFLVGESLMREPDMAQALRRLRRDL